MACREGEDRPAPANPVDAPAFDADITDEWSQFTKPLIGMKVPVLYDPKHHSKVVLDTGGGSSRIGLRQQWATEARSAWDSRGPVPAPAGRSGFAARMAALGIPDVAQLQSDLAAGRYGAGQKRVLFDSNDPKFRSEALPGAPKADSPSADPLDRLQKLADLHDRGALTDAEFEAAKAKILGSS